jgi:hypothetical protein
VNRYTASPYTRALALTFYDAGTGDTVKLTAAAPPGAGSVTFAALVLAGGRGATVAEWQRAHPTYRLLSYAPVRERVRWGTRGQFLVPAAPGATVPQAPAPA